MPTYHTQPSPTWRDRFTERELRLLANARTYAENDPAGLPGHNLLLIIARLADTLDTLPLHEVSPDIEELPRDFFEQRWRGENCRICGRMRMCWGCWGCWCRIQGGE